MAKEIRSRPSVPKIYSGLKELDEILGGFTPSQVIVIAAQTKSGKTSFCMELTIQMADQHPVWLPFEEPADELIQKFIDRGEEPPVFYTPQKLVPKNIEWVEQRIIEAQAKFDSKIMFIDHLSFLTGMSMERQDLLIGETMRGLKTMANKWGMIIVLISHLRKTRMTDLPNLEDLRDSSYVAQEADTVIMLWRKTERSERGKMEIGDMTTISVQANRRTGRTGNFRRKYEKGRFTEVTNYYDEEDM
jgi:replicative DNA helicase